jgi:hypothetical protein
MNFLHTGFEQPKKARSGMQLLLNEVLDFFWGIFFADGEAEGI